MMKIGVIGYGTIGKRVAAALLKMSDMELVGVAKTTPDYEALLAAQRGLAVYSVPGKEAAFRDAGIPIKGSMIDLVRESNIIIDATPDGVGEENKAKYYMDKRAIFQGGEEASVAEVSFNALANYENAIGKKYIRVVSCNTTALSRLLAALSLTGHNIRKVRAFLVRRGADPRELKKGPINDVVPNPVTIPSHHGPDVKTVIPVNITTVAVAVPVTIMHLHMVNVEFDESPRKDDVINSLMSTPRISVLYAKMGFQSLAQVIEYARDLGRERGDFMENAVFGDSISIEGNEVYLMQGVHQESIVVPENIDAVRAMMGVPKWESIMATDKALGLYSSDKKYG